MPKVVFSSTTSTVPDWNTRLVTGDAVTEITRLKAEDGWPHGHRRAPHSLPAAASGLGLDRRVTCWPPHSVLVGSGTPFFTALDNWVNLNLVETRVHFLYGVVLTRYETKR